MGKWEMVSFEDALDDVTKLATKIKKERYLSNGDYQIVDQGKDYIAGYSDEEEGIYSDIPVIVFGDHTRVIKYVCVPLFIGADGVKLLKVKRSDLETKFVYYYLKSRRIIDTGYNRHFKWLKEFGIPVPSLEEQQQIINTLDEINMLISLRKQQLEELDLLVKSRFVEMFGNELNRTQITLKDACTIITDGTHQSPKFVSDGVPFLFVSNIVDGNIDYNTQKFISHDEYKSLIKRTPVEIGDILFTIVGSYGNPAIVKFEKEFCFQRHIAYLKPMRTKFASEYLHSVLQASYVKEQVERRVKGIAQKTLNLFELKEIKINGPPLPLQNRFADFVHQTDKSKFIIDYEANLAIMLYESLSHAL